MIMPLHSLLTLWKDIVLFHLTVVINNGVVCLYTQWQNGIFCAQLLISTWKYYLQNKRMCDQKIIHLEGNKRNQYLFSLVNGDLQFVCTIHFPPFTTHPKRWFLKRGCFYYCLYSNHNCHNPTNWETWEN